MRRLALVGLLLALPFVAVPLVWAATNGGSRSSVCTAVERGDRESMTMGEPSVPPLRWDAHSRAVPAERLGHNLRHGGIAVQYGSRVSRQAVQHVLAWYRRDSVAVVVAPKPELGDRIELSSWSGSARCGTFADTAFSTFRDERRFQGPESPPRTELAPVQAVEQLRATPRRISFVVSAAAGVSVEVQDGNGRVVRRLGHFTLADRQRLIVTWDGRSLASGRYVAVVTAAGAGSFRTLFELR